MLNAPLIPVSWGELFDKLSILDLKRQKIPDAAAKSNVERELASLSMAIQSSAVDLSQIDEFLKELSAVNLELWEVEDRLRGKEQIEDFGQEFIGLARSVYKLNDRRAAVKRMINRQLHSELVEEKSYSAR